MSKQKILEEILRPGHLFTAGTKIKKQFKILSNSIDCKIFLK